MRRKIKIDWDRINGPTLVAAGPPDTDEIEHITWDQFVLQALILRGTTEPLDVIAGIERATRLVQRATLFKKGGWQGEHGRLSQDWILRTIAAMKAGTFNWKTGRIVTTA